MNGDELRCRIVGEGGNLGLTQLGRIEYAAAGGRVNTDAIDNSGGVDCSDHEVNIKVLLNEVVSAGDMTGKQRNQLLEDMTGEVAALVLRNNYLQTQALGVAASQASSLLEVHSRLIRRLERDGELDREIEFLPGAEEIAERLAAHGGLHTPELSVLIAYVKNRLYQRLLGSTLPGEPFVANELHAYFPSALRERYADLIPAHRLAREIAGAVIANEMVNWCGITFAFRLGEETGADEADIARAYLVSREVYGMRGTWEAIEGLDNVVGADVQTTMLLETRKLVERGARWLLRNRPRPLDVERDVAYFAGGVTALRGRLEDLVADASRTALDAARARLVGARRSRGPGPGGRLRQRPRLRAGCGGGRVERGGPGRRGGVGLLRTRGEARPALAAGPDRGAAPRQPLAGAVARRAARRSVRAARRADPGRVAPRCRRGGPGRACGRLARAEPDPGRPVPADPRRSGGRRQHGLHDALGRDGRDPHPAPGGVIGSPPVGRAGQRE